MNTTAVVSFRCHKNMRNWLVYAGQGFDGGKSELLRLIIERAVMEQYRVSGLGSFLNHFVRDHSTSIGDTTVFAVRLRVDIVTSAKEIAVTKRLGISEWCTRCKYTWLEGFKPYYELHKEEGRDWIQQYAALYRTKVYELADVYASKCAKLVKITLPRGGNNEKSKA